MNTFCAFLRRVPGVETLHFRDILPTVFVVGVSVLLIATAASAGVAVGVPANLVTTPPFPEGLAVSPDGTLYVAIVAFAPSSEILVLTPRGETLGSIPVSAGPGGITDLVGEAFDSHGNLYVADFADALVAGSCGCNGRVLRIAPDGDIATVASGFGFPNGLAFNAAGTLYITDSFAGTVSRLSPDGTLSVFVNSDLLRAPAGSNPPVGANGILFTRDGRSMLVANTQAGTIVQIPIARDGSAGTPSVLASNLIGADGIAIDVMGNVYVAVNFQNKIAMLAPDGTLLATFQGTGANALRNPASLSFLGRRLFITDLAAFIPGATPGLSVMMAPFPGAPLEPEG